MENNGNYEEVLKIKGVNANVNMNSDESVNFIVPMPPIYSDEYARYFVRKNFTR